MGASHRAAVSQYRVPELRRARAAVRRVRDSLARGQDRRPARDAERVVDFDRREVAGVIRPTLWRRVSRLSSQRPRFLESTRKGDAETMPGTSQSSVEGADPILLRVMPLIRHLDVEGGGTLVLILLELWQDWLTITWLGAPPVDEGRSRPTPPGRNVEDDVGTPYRLAAGGGGGGSTYIRGTVSFQPAPPATANVLRITPPRVVDGCLSAALR